MPTYAAYGLVIEADFAIPELAAGTGAPDVVIRLDAVPKRLDNAVAGGAVYQTDGTRLLLDLDRIARYLVIGGREIRVQPAPRVPWSDVRVFLLGSCLGALLHQRGLFLLHASAVATRAAGVLFCGPSGVGKSTLLGALLQRGHTMAADDLAALAVADGRVPRLLPSFPRLRLWQDAAVALGKDVAALSRTRATLQKYDVAAAPQFLAAAAPARRIYLLSTHDKESIDIAPVSPSARLEVLTRQTYRNRFLDGLGLRQRHTRLARAVAASVEVRVVHRPSARYCLNELADAIEADLGPGTPIS